MYFTKNLCILIIFRVVEIEVGLFTALMIVMIIMIKSTRSILLSFINLLYHIVSRYV